MVGRLRWLPHVLLGYGRAHCGAAQTGRLARHTDYRPEEPDKDGVDVGILEGGISNTYNEEVAKKMRSRCKILVALGDCAVFGGVPAMRNFTGDQAALERAYMQTESTDESGKIPDDPELAQMVRVRPVSDVVKVDVFLPGCAPSADAIFYVLSELAQGRIPEVSGDYNDWH